MSDAWDEIQAIKIKRNSLRERLEKRKKERQDILGSTGGGAASLQGAGSSSIKNDPGSFDDKKLGNPNVKLDIGMSFVTNSATILNSVPFSTMYIDNDPEVEKLLLQILSDSSIILPTNSKLLAQRMNLLRFRPVSNIILNYFLQKLAAQSYISIKDITSAEADACFEVILVEHVRVQSLYNEIVDEIDGDTKGDDLIIKRKCTCVSLP